MIDERGPVRVVVTRGGVIESAHAVHTAVVDERGRDVALWGEDPTTFLRSAAKPFQALPLVEDGVADALGLDARLLAVCCASHNSEDEHVAAVREILGRAGLDESLLACRPHRPLNEEVAERLLRDGHQLAPVHSNCSGKHAGMLVLAAHHGWPLEGYHEEDHPVQRRMRSEIARWTGLEAGRIDTAVDGCGVSCFAVPLRRAAHAFARLAAAADRGEPAARVVDAMRAHPFMVAGSDRLCTDLMERAGQWVFCKTGAEGVYGAGILGRGLGVALKAADGARRAADVALVAVLRELEALDDDHAAALRAHARPSLANTRGETVGAIRAEVPGPR